MKPISRDKPAWIWSLQAKAWWGHGYWLQHFRIHNGRWRVLVVCEFNPLTRSYPYKDMTVQQFYREVLCATG